MLSLKKSDLRLGYNLWRNSVYDKYLGSTLGLFWSIGNPLMMFALYTFVFGFVLKVRLPGADTTLDFVIWLICGFGPWLASIEAIMGATISIVAASGMVKNMMFKTELLPISSALTGLITLIVGLVFLFVIMVINKNIIGVHVLWVPLIIIVHFFFIIAFGLWLSAINVFIRDLSIALPNLLMIFMFMTPILYPIEAMPEIVQIVSYYNPVYIIIEGYRTSILDNSMPDIYGFLYVILISSVVFLVGLKVFGRAKKHFDAVL